MKNPVFYGLIIIVIIAETNCLNKEVYEDTDEYEFDFKDIKEDNNKSELDTKLSLNNSTSFNGNISDRQKSTDFDTSEESQLSNDKTETDGINQEMVVPINRNNQQLMAPNILMTEVPVGSVATTIMSTDRAVPTSTQSTVGSTLAKILKIETTTGTPSMIPIKIDETPVPYETTIVSTAKTTVPSNPIPIIATITTKTTDSPLTTGVTTLQILIETTQQRLQTKPETSITTVSVPQLKDILQATEVSKAIEISTTPFPKTAMTTIDPMLAQLLNDSDEDDIILPHNFDSGIGSDLFMRPSPQTNRRQRMRNPNFKSNPMIPSVGPEPLQSPLSPVPIFPIMPPQLPETPGYQTIWVPIQVRRDGHSIDEMWKRSKTPNFIERGHLKHQPLMSDGNPNSWWRRSRPKYCFEPIVVNYFCADRRPLKKWSYNEADERCYRYIDYCSAHKLNSFNSLQDCLLSCWRARI